MSLAAQAARLFVAPPRRPIPEPSDALGAVRTVAVLALHPGADTATPARLLAQAAARTRRVLLTDLTDVTPDDLPDALAYAHRTYELVVLDTGPATGPQTMPVLHAADRSLWCARAPHLDLGLAGDVVLRAHQPPGSSGERCDLVRIPAVLDEFQQDATGRQLLALLA